MNDFTSEYDYKYMNLRSAKTTKERRTLIETEKHVSLESVAVVLVDEKTSIHCENLVGAISLPLGVAGPLIVHGSEKTYEALIPLATTEGALVASVSRGCKVISQAGGAMTTVDPVGTTRGPVFETKSIRHSRELVKTVQAHFEVLSAEAAKTSSHLELIDIETAVNGKYVYMRFIYDTDQAMGMNMVTIATDQIVSYIEEHFDTRCIAVAGNYDVDKKPAWLNVIRGRGRVCQAEIVIPEKLVTELLKVTPKALAKTVIMKCWAGSMMSGSMGFNAHFANIVAAFFAATGQDIAHVVEGSLGITTAEVCENGDLYFSVYMPDIMLGMVGGGTKLKTQTEARSMTGASNTNELAEVLVSAVLAGELSLLASITEKTLGKAHKKLGR